MSNNIFSKRMREAMEEKHITAAELSRVTGIGKSSISEYLAGSYLPKQNNTLYIALALGVSPSWLMGGQTKLMPGQITPDDQDLLNDYHKLNAVGKQIAAATVKSLATNPEYTTKEKTTSA